MYVWVYTCLSIWMYEYMVLYVCMYACMNMRVQPHRSPAELPTRLVDSVTHLASYVTSDLIGFPPLQCYPDEKLWLLAYCMYICTDVSETR